jgi:hypothetical protein
MMKKETDSYRFKSRIRFFDHQLDKGPQRLEETDGLGVVFSSNERALKQKEIKL